MDWRWVFGKFESETGDGRRLTVERVLSRTGAPLNIYEWKILGPKFIPNHGHEILKSGRAGNLTMAKNIAAKQAREMDYHA